MANFKNNIEDSALSLIKLALEEDRVNNDATGIAAFKNEQRKVSVNVVAREFLVAAGLPVISLIYGLIDEKITVKTLFNDGDKINKNETIAVVSGPAISVLSGERTILNFIQRLTGIATLTAKYVDEVEGTNVKIIDTRKTTPGWRLLEKYAVKCGGGVNHRFNLADMVMFKDNHIALSGKSITELIKTARKDFPSLKIACEADTIEQVKILLDADVDIIMLDNMSIEMTKQAVKLAGGGVVLESTGGITLDNVRAVDWLSPSGENFLATFCVPQGDITEDNLVSFAAANALSIVLKDYCFTPQCKWPNDIEICDGKIAGILTEKVNDWFLIGIGLNLNWPKKKSELESGRKITSLFAESGKKFNADEFVLLIGEALNSQIKKSADAILKLYKSFWNKKRNIEILVDGKWIPAKQTGIDLDGTLITKLTSGKLIKINTSARIRTNDI